jgi:hypothetical protein
MSADCLGELGLSAQKLSSVCSTQKLTKGELSYAIFPDLAVFCFLFIQKWGGLQSDRNTAIFLWNALLTSPATMALVWSSWKGSH